jgi:hypothetical protein
MLSDFEKTLVTELGGRNQGGDVIQYVLRGMMGCLYLRNEVAHDG